MAFTRNAVPRSSADGRVHMSVPLHSGTASVPDAATLARLADDAVTQPGRINGFGPGTRAADPDFMFRLYDKTRQWSLSEEPDRLLPEPWFVHSRSYVGLSSAQARRARVVNATVWIMDPRTTYDPGAPIPEKVGGGTGGPFVYPTGGAPAITATSWPTFKLQDLFAGMVVLDNKLSTDNHDARGGDFAFVSGCLTDINKAGAFSTGCTVVLDTGTVTIQTDGSGNYFLVSSDGANGPFAPQMLACTIHGHARDYLGGGQVKLTLPDSTTVTVKPLAYVNAGRLQIAVDTGGHIAAAAGQAWDPVAGPFIGGTVLVTPWNEQTSAPESWQENQEAWNAATELYCTAIGQTGLGIVPAGTGLHVEANTVNDSDQWWNDENAPGTLFSTLIPGSGTSAASSDDGSAHWSGTPSDNLLDHVDAVWAEAMWRPVSNGQFDPSVFTMDRLVGDAMLALSSQQRGTYFHCKTRLNGKGGPSYTDPDTSTLYQGFATSLRGGNPNWWGLWRTRLVALYLLCDRGYMIVEITNDDNDANPLTDANYPVYQLAFGAPTGPATWDIHDSIVTPSTAISAPSSGAGATIGRSVFQTFEQGALVLVADEPEPVTFTVDRDYWNAETGRSYPRTFDLNPLDTVLLTTTRPTARVFAAPSPSMAQSVRVLADISGSGQTVGGGEGGRI